MVKTITASALAEFITSNSDNLLLLDTRSSEHFNAGCIMGSVNAFCCSTIILRRLKKGGNVCVDSFLSSVEDKEKFSKATSSENISVVVYDDSTCCCSELSSDSLTAMLVKKLTRECKNVQFLEGGFEQFRRQLPKFCSPQQSSHPSHVMLKSRPSSLVLQLTSLSMDCTLDSQSSSDSEGSEPPSPINYKRARAFEILPYLYLGSKKAASNTQSLKENGVSRILNVTSEASEYQHLEGFRYYQIAVEDVHEVNMLQHLPSAFAFIEDARMSNEKVLVHCHAGMSRSVTVVLAYLMKYYAHTFHTAYDFVKQKKSNISPNFSFLEQLLEFESSLRPSPPDSGISSGIASPVDGPCAIDVFSKHPSKCNLTPEFTRRCILAA